MASHICAAAEGGPRYDPKMTPQERSAVENGMWTCRNHGTAIDSPDPEYTAELLRRWKKEAEAHARQRVLDGSVQATTKTTAAAADLRRAAIQDMEVLRLTDRWPVTDVELTVRFEDDRESTPTKSLAKTLVPLGDLLLVAPPGMGKTTALMQLYQELLASESGLPIFVPLADWATGTRDLLESICYRASFEGVTQQQLRSAAAEAGVVLMLDGWNELDQAARQRARVQLTTLKAELPLLGLVIATRRQAVNVPVDALRVDLQPLSYRQQTEIARQMLGGTGLGLVDRAWRTPGIRELVSTPLYLNALLSLPIGTDFPSTREALLGHFVQAHGRRPEQAEPLRSVLSGLHEHYLTDLAVQAMRACAVALPEVDARRSVMATGMRLTQDQLLAAPPAPQDALDVLVSSHALMRAPDTHGYLFQHQQIQEWFGSHYVEACILAARVDVAQRQDMQRVILDAVSWEESVLFATERLAQSPDATHIAACGEAICAALEVDPLLAAEMIFRSSDAVWAQIEPRVQAFARAWHHVGSNDRAIRFMLTCGRPDFMDIIWPLVTDEDEHVSLGALRNCRHLRRSIFGPAAAEAMTRLAPRVREILISEIAMHGDVEAIDLATELAKADSDAKVQEAVFVALLYRQADRHVAELLQAATEETINKLATSHGFDILEVADTPGRERIVQAQRLLAQKDGEEDRLVRISRAPYDASQEDELLTLLSTMEIDPQSRRLDTAIYDLQSAYTPVVVQAIMARVLAGRPMFTQAMELVSASGLVQDDPALLEVARKDLDGHATANLIAATVLGPRSVSTLLDELFEMEPRRKQDGAWDRTVTDVFYNLLRRLAMARPEALLEAIQPRSAHVSTGQMELMADLLVRCRGLRSNHSRNFSQPVQDQIAALVCEWGDAMLAAGDAGRGQTAVLAQLAECAPAAQWLSVLQRLLDDNLQRYREFRMQAQTQGWRPGIATTEARWPHTFEYARALAALDDPAARQLLFSYLGDRHFGEEAAGVLVQNWCRTHEPQRTGIQHFGRPNFSLVARRRAELKASPTRSCEEANAVFAVIRDLLSDAPQESLKDRHALAVGLGLHAARLPHGPWCELETQMLGITPHRARGKLMLHLALSGSTLPLEEVAKGIVETIAAAKGNNWHLLQQDAFEIREWLQLLPLTDRPLKALELLSTLPAELQTPHSLRDLLQASEGLGAEEGAQLVFRLAELFPAFLDDHDWLTTLMRLATLDVGTAERLLGMAAKGIFDAAKWDRGFLVRHFGAILESYPAMRGRTYQLLEGGLKTAGLQMLASAVAESPDAAGVLLLVRVQMAACSPFTDYRAVERVVTERVPSTLWSGTFEVIPAAAGELRRTLLAMSTDGGPGDAAAQCLRIIDAIRDRHGMAEQEPRHPDLASGKPWPLLNAQAFDEALY